MPTQNRPVYEVYTKNSKSDDCDSEARRISLGAEREDRVRIAGKNQSQQECVAGDSC